MISIKRTLHMAFEKIIRTSRKGKLMLFSFLVAGMVISVTVGLLSAAVIVDPEPFMQLPKGYIRIEETSLSYNNLMNIGADDETFRIFPYQRHSLEFIFPTGDLSGATLYGQLEDVSAVGTRDLSHGRLPVNDTEILVSLELAEAITKGQTGQDFGIWHIEQLFFETLRIGHLDLKIVGVVKTGMTLIYVSPDLAGFIHGGTNYMSSNLFDANDLIAGQMPNADQMVISNVQYESIYGTAPSGTFPKTYTMGLFSITISGVHDVAILQDVIIIHPGDVIKRAYEQAYGIHVFSEDRVGLLSKLQMAGLNGVDVYEQAFQYAKDQQRLVLISTLTSSVILIGFAAVGFYFVIRSSLISRIYEISVYRALGVKKGDIFRSFTIEIFILTTLSTLTGYLLASFALMRLQDGLLGQFNFFKVTPITFLLGILLSYTINVLAGLLPVHMLLQKTPAQILSQYDI